MTHYRDNRVPGGTFFFTVRLLDRGSTLLTDHFSAFGEAMRQARIRKPFHVDAWVVLPDHAHAIWTLPPGDHDCSTRWRAVKIAFSKALHKACLPGTRPASLSDSAPVNPVLSATCATLASELLKDLDARVVKDGDSWARTRRAFSILLGQWGDGATLASGRAD